MNNNSTREDNFDADDICSCYGATGDDVDDDDNDNNNIINILIDYLTFERVSHQDQSISFGHIDIF